MSTDIDMKSYAGEQKDSAAENQQNVEVNSYQSEQNEDVAVQQEIVDQIKEEAKEVQPEVVEQAPSKQELNFKALREEVDRIKAEKDELKQNLDMIKANVAYKQQEPLKEKQLFEGLNKEDIPNVGDIERVFKEREEAYQARIEELQVAQMHPDYAEVIGKFTLPLVQQKPHLAKEIEGAKNKALLAYELGKMAQNASSALSHKETPTQNINKAQKIVDNARKPGTLSQTGGQAALSKADYYASMSDTEFLKFASKNFD